MKKLYRSRTNKVFGGVAGGFAEYFDIDPILMRLIFIVLLASGFFVIAYLIAWMMVPLAPVPGAPTEPST